MKLKSFLLNNYKNKNINTEEKQISQQYWKVPL